MPLPSYKFGEFQLDPTRFELRRKDRSLKLERIPMDLLILLVEKDGQVVSRQEIAERLWGKDVFIDTEHGINTAIRKIRTALRDDIQQPRFVQTVSGKGYRFIGERRNGNAEASTLPQPNEPAGEDETVEAAALARDAIEPRHHNHVPWWWTAVSIVTTLVLLAALIFTLKPGGIYTRISANHRIGPIHSIAVLPLANLSGDPSQDYYADGLTDELITALAHNQSLRVVSRTSIMQYKGAKEPLRDIAQALAVDGILEGSVNRSGNQVHANLQLVYAPTDTHVWAQSYDRDLSSAMSLLDEVALTIAVEAKVAPAPVRAKRAINPEAHEAYLHGRYLWFAENGDRGREYFKKAIEIQPDYAAAWDGLGDTYPEQAMGREIPPQEAFAKAEEFVSKALALDDSLPEVHNSMAAIYLFNKWDFQHAEAESLRSSAVTQNRPFMVISGDLKTGH